MAVSPLSASQSIEPFYFGDAHAPLFGVINPAPVSAERGVLICAPIGYENVIYHRQLGILARRLAARGRPVLRFDWPGCGDSAGDDDTPGMIESSLASVQTAIDALRDRTGVQSVDLIGLRFGATLAGSAIDGADGVSDVVFWDPFSTGREYLRALRAFNRLTLREDEKLEQAASAESAMGFLLAPSTIAGIETLDLTRGTFGQPRRFMISGRERARLDALVEHIRSLGHEVTVTELAGLREAALGWTERPVPTESFATIERWLGCSEPLPVAPARPVSSSNPAAEITMPDGVRERPVVWTGERQMLGLTAHHDQADGNDSWMVFIPNRYARRIGPNGLYRRWARSWATLGLPSLRIDVNGTGDAGGPDEETDRDMYQREGADDVLRGVAFIRENMGARRVAVMGLCSGGYIGFHAALRDPAIEDVFLLNPQMLLWTDHETAVTRASTFKDRMWRARSWKRLLRNPRTWVPAVLPVVGESLLADLKWRLAKLRGKSDRPGAVPVSEWIQDAVAQLGERGCRLHFIFSEGDAGLGYLERHLGPEMTGLADQPNVTIDVVEGADHTFNAMDRQVVLHDLIASILTKNRYGLRTNSAALASASAPQTTR